MRPPERFRTATFETYRASEPSQADALSVARAFVDHLKARPTVGQRLKRLFGTPVLPWRGLYLVGPVGTGKTHLLASMVQALEPEVPCAFLHSSALFRMTEHPEAFARRIARDYRVLAVDEVEIDDPANEARLVLLFHRLADLGVVLLATSNVEPDRFLSAEFGNDRFRRFLHEEFRQRYRVVVVGGDDYRRRLQKPGRAWIGPLPEARAAMQDAFARTPGLKQWMSFEELVRAATDTAHARLVGDLLDADHLFLDGLAITGPDDALRLLRIIDDLYLAPDPPTLYFTAEAPPEALFDPATTHGGLERGIAEKFTRTTSRLAALCEIEHLGAEAA